MKKIKLLTFALIAITFASCKKDITCTCSISSIDSGIDYDYVLVGVNTQVQTSEEYSTQNIATRVTSYEKVSGAFGKENCPTLTNYTDPYDNTYKTSQSLKVGRVGQTVNKSTCVIE